MSAHVHAMDVPFDIDGTEIMLDVAYTFLKGAPEVRYQNNGDPGWPADPDEIEIHEVRIKGGDAVPKWFGDALCAGNKVMDYLHEHHKEPEPDCDYDPVEAAERNRIYDNSEDYF